VPVDLNCLLWFLEDTLSKLHKELQQPDLSEQYKTAADARKNAIQDNLWEDRFCEESLGRAQSGFYHDYCISDSSTTDIKSLAGTLPLFFNLASEEQASSVTKWLEKDFLKAGGLVTTLSTSPQQWDSPNGWAPLQWFAVIALENYGKQTLANRVMANWLTNIEKCYQHKPALMEKYNVVQPGIIASGGEYDVQEGFGWTNGVTRAFYEKLSKSRS
jgi:alpha,alpha-trehalase